MSHLVYSSMSKLLPPTPPTPHQQPHREQTSCADQKAHLATSSKTAPSVSRQIFGRTAISRSRSQLDKPLPATPPHNPNPGIFDAPSKMSAAAVDKIVSAWIRNNTETIPNAELSVLDECLICLDTYTSEAAKRVNPATCGHVFGEKCLIKVLKINSRRETRCPLCRAAWMPAIGQPQRRRDGQPLTAFLAAEMPPPEIFAGNSLIASTASDPATARGVDPLYLPPRHTIPALTPPTPISDPDMLEAARTSQRGASSVLPGLGTATLRPRPVADYPSLIILDSDSDNEDSFEDLTRDIENVRNRARRTGLTRRQRREQDAALRDATRVRDLPARGPQSRPMSLIDQVKLDREAHIPLGSMAERQLPPGQAANANANANANLPVFAQTQAQEGTANSKRIHYGLPRTNHNNDALPPFRILATPTPRRPQPPRIPQNPFLQSASPSPTTALPTDLDSDSDTDLGPSAVTATTTRKRSQRVPELQNEQAKKKETELKQQEKELSRRERNMHQSEQRLFQREQSVAQRERRAETLEALRQRQAEELRAMLARHHEQTMLARYREEPTR